MVNWFMAIKDISDRDAVEAPGAPVKPVLLLMLVLMLGCHSDERYRDARFDLLVANKILIGPRTDGRLLIADLTSDRTIDAELSGSEPTSLNGMTILETVTSTGTELVSKGDSAQV